jgi:LysR family cyn operon transcriptional activator
MRIMDIFHGLHAYNAFMDLLLMRSLLAVADAGSITEAADRIGVTQPALSRRIQQLEAHFGATLLDRGRKGASLTDVGQLVEHEGRVLVARFDQLRDRVAAHVGLDAGTVRVGGGATAVSFVVPSAIARFQSEFPGVRFQVKEAGSREIESDVVSGRLDIGLVTMPVDTPDLDVTPLLVDRIVLVASPTHPLSTVSPLGVESLTRQSLVGFEAGSAIRQLIDSKLREAGVEMNVVMELRSIPAILRMVATTGNLAFVSQLGVDQQPDVRILPVGGIRIERELGVIRRRGVQLSPAAAQFADRLQAGVADSN